MYLAEYVINQGISPTLLFPIDEMPFDRYRDAYVTYGTLYQRKYRLFDIGASRLTTFSWGTYLEILISILPRPQTVCACSVTDDQSVHLHCTVTLYGDTQCLSFDDAHVL